MRNLTPLEIDRFRNYFAENTRDSLYENDEDEFTAECAYDDEMEMTDEDVLERIQEYFTESEIEDFLDPKTFLDSKII